MPNLEIVVRCKDCGEDIDQWNLCGEDNDRAAHVCDIAGDLVFVHECEKAPEADHA